jgi:diguanylate cyclase (GGDEF)-like protein
MKLRTKFLAILLGLCSAILLPIGFLAEASMESAINDHLSSVKNQTSGLLREKINSHVEKLRLLSRVTADQPGTKSLLTADSEVIYDTVSEYLNTLATQSNVSWVVLVDPDGKDLGFSDGSRSKLSKEDIRSLIASARPGAELTNFHSETALVGSADIQVAGYKKGTVFFGQTVDSKFLRSMGEILDIQLSTVAFRNDLPDSTVWELTPTEGVNQKWYARFDNRRVTSSYQKLSNAIKIALFSSLFLSLLASILLAKGLTQPMEKLLSATRTLETGNWPEPMQMQRSDEFGELANAFDTMTSSMRESYLRLESMIYIDPLTGLDNHSTFKKKAKAILETREFENGLNYLCLLNIDDFDTLNRERGIAGGDSVLIQVAESLREIPGISLIARNSSDEFLIWIEEANPEFVHQRVKELLEERVRITFRMGIAKASEVLAEIDLLLFAAKQALAQAKIAGKGKFRILNEVASIHETNDLMSFFHGGSYSAVRALAEAVDAKDEYTRGHSERVAQYSRELAAFCGYDQGFLDLIYLTGTLHDVGKIGVPDRALKKAGKLDDEEFEMIKLHPGLGEKIVSQIPELVDTLPGIRHHHERFDGRGYPDRLVGAEISDMARILAIADTFDAMTSNRPYRNGLPEHVALEEIEKNAGTQFDPEFAIRFVEMRRLKSTKKVAS